MGARVTIRANVTTWLVLFRSASARRNGWPHRNRSGGVRDRDSRGCRSSGRVKMIMGAVGGAGAAARDRSLTVAARLARFLSPGAATLGA